MPRETLRSQINCVLSDIGADVVKTGMLPSAEVGSTALAFECPGPLQIQLRRVSHNAPWRTRLGMLPALCHLHRGAFTPC